MSVTARVNVILCLSFILLLAGCASPKRNTDAESKQIEIHSDLLSAAEQFVHSNLYAGIIHVRDLNLLNWNQLLIAYSCSPDAKKNLLEKSYLNNYPLFTEQMVSLAAKENLFSTEQQRDVLIDVSHLAYRLFSSSYATGYAHQIQLAEQLSPGIRQELCDGNAGEPSSKGLAYPKDIKWRSFESSLLQYHNGLAAHAKKGDEAFQRLLEQQYLQFDALVYSHAYQQADAYQTLFFEVNKFENVELYGQYVFQLSPLLTDFITQKKHNDFAYLALASGYHWGMMSVLVMLEEEYPEVHELKKQQAIRLINNTISELVEKL